MLGCNFTAMGINTTLLPENSGNCKYESKQQYNSTSYLALLLKTTTVMGEQHLKKQNQSQATIHTERVLSQSPL